MADRLKNHLRQWRIDNDLTLQEVADLVGVDIAHLSRAERNLVGFAPMTRVRVARRLGVRVADLFDLEPVDDALPTNGAEVAS